MITKVTGFIVSTVNFHDTSLVMNIFTKEYGLIGVLGKGVKRMNHPLRAFAQKFTYGTFYIYYKEGKLSLLKDIDLLDSFSYLHEDIIRIGYLNYITELVTQVYKQSENEKLFDLFMDVVFKMNAGFDLKILTNILEVKCLPLLGVGILLDECVKCGNTKDIVTIDGDAGGLICKNCYQNEKLVSIQSIHLIRMYYYVDVKSITKLNIKKEQVEEINRFLETYYNRYTGLYLKSKDFLEQLNGL